MLYSITGYSWLKGTKYFKIDLTRSQPATHSIDFIVCLLYVHVVYSEDIGREVVVVPYRSHLTCRGGRHTASYRFYRHSLSIRTHSAVYEHHIGLRFWYWKVRVLGSDLQLFDCGFIENRWTVDRIGKGGFVIGLTLNSHVSLGVVISFT